MRDKFEKYLKQQKKRCTPERFAILDTALGLQRYFTARDVFENMALSSDICHPTIASVYSTLKLLVDSKLLREVTLDGKKSRFEFQDKSSNNVHIICTQCGKIRDVKDPGFKARMRARRFNAFTMEYYTLNIYGICNACARKLNHRSRKK